MLLQEIVEELIEETSYTTSQSSIVYTSRKKGPASTLDLRRLNTATPFKTKLHIPAKKQKKKIILSDFRFQMETFTEILSKRFELIKELLAQDIEVYILNAEGGLEKINRKKWVAHSIYISELFKKSQVGKKNKIIKKISSLVTDTEHYHVIDYAETQRLIAKEKKLKIKLSN